MTKKEPKFTNAFKWIVWLIFMRKIKKKWQKKEINNLREENSSDRNKVNTNTVSYQNKQVIYLTVTENRCVFVWAQTDLHKREWRSNTHTHTYIQTQNDFLKCSTRCQ